MTEQEFLALEPQECSECGHLGAVCSHPSCTSRVFVEAEALTAMRVCVECWKVVDIQYTRLKAKGEIK